MKRHFRHPSLEFFDLRIADWMAKYGHFIERILLGGIFIWFGSLKWFGNKSATSIIAELVYWSKPEIVVPFLGVWEILIGVFLIYRRLVRVAILLLLIRLPGTILSLIFHFDECFVDSLWVPTIQGQYLLKDFTLIGAALVIGGTVRWEKRPGIHA